MTKLTKMGLQRNSFNGGIDLLIERDSGNEFLVMFGRKERSVKNWRKLRRVCNRALKFLKEEEAKP